MTDRHVDPTRQPVIVGAARTPIGRFLGGLAPLSAPELGAIAIRAALQRSGVDPARVQEVIMGQVLQGGAGQAPARQAMLRAGVPATASAMTINKVCGSGLQAVMLAAQAIKAGDAEVVVAGGQESMSNAPFYVQGMRGGVKMGDQAMVDGMIRDGLWCPTCNVHMGSHAEYTATKAGITRAQQDAFAAESHRRAAAAQAAGKFAAEIVPVEIPGRKGPTVVAADEGPRGDTTAESLSALRPAFGAKGADPASLTVTAGNASSINDGAAALVVTSEAVALAEGLPILGRITGYGSGAGAPQDLFFAPITAVRNLMARLGTTIDHYDLIEANEAFAAQACAVNKDMGWDVSKVNVNGGAIAIGHPVGASGARVLNTLLFEMRRRGARKGLATLCIGGGMGIALCVER
jgi:acetyl-CoA C-acetyltransferase